MTRIMYKTMSDLNFNNKNIDRVSIRVEVHDAQYPERVKEIMGDKAALNIWTW